MPNILDNYKAQINRDITSKTEPSSITRFNTTDGYIDLANLALLTTELQTSLTYPKDWLGRDAAYGLYLAKQNNVTGDYTISANWEPIGGGGSIQRVFSLAVSNTGDDYTASNALVSYNTETIYLFPPSATNTGAATLDVNSLGVVPIKKFSSGAIVDVDAGDLDDANTLPLIYKGSYFLIIGGGGGSATEPTYSGATPSTNTVGAILPGFDPTGFTSLELWERALVSYQAPTFSSFSISGQSSTIEVGTALSGSKTFLWATTNNGNILPNSIAVRDVTANTLIGSGLANDGSESLSIGTITNTSPITRAWRAEGTEQNDPATNDTFVSSNFTVSSVYPFFYMVSSSPITDTDMQAAIAAGTATKVLSGASGTINITFGATGQYLAFAYQAAYTTKTVWFVSALNNGSIGGGSNLFSSQSTLAVNSPTGLWTGVNYKIHVSNYATTTSGNMELRNS